MNAKLLERSSVRSRPLISTGLVLVLTLLFVAKELLGLSTSASLTVTVFLLLGFIAIGIPSLAPSFSLLPLGIWKIDSPIQVGFLSDLNQVYMLVILPGLIINAWQQRKEVPRTASWGLLGLVVGTIYASVSQHASISNIARGAFQYVAFLVLIVGFSTKMRLRPTLMALSFSALVNFVGVVCQVIGFYSFVGPPYASDRFDGFFGYYTVMSAWTAVATIVLYQAAIQERTRLGRSWFFGTSALSFFTVFLSLSRGGILVLGGALACLILLGNRTTRVGLSITLPLTGLLLFVLLRPVVNQVVQRFVGAEGGNDFLRNLLQQTGRSMLALHPLGVGVGEFSNTVKSGEISFSGKALYHCHQLFVQMALDCGLPAAVLFGFTILVACMRVILQSNVRAASWPMTGLACVVGVAAQGIGDYILHEVGGLIAVALPIGLLMRLRLTPATALNNVEPDTQVG